MTIKLRTFRGEIPRISETLLPDGFATTCINTRGRSGILEPFHGPSLVPFSVTGAPNLSFGWFGNDGGWRMMGANGWVNPSSTDLARYYYGADATPARVASFGAGAYDYPLRLLPPTSQPSVLITAGTLDPNTQEEVVFAYTHVTELGEESQPSALSARINWSAGVTITVGTFAVVPAGRGINRRRIYRSVINYAGVATLHFVAEIVIATLSLAYVTQFIAEPISSTDFDPPLATLKGVRQMPNGMLVGFSGKSLYFSEPYIYHAWPIKYELRTDTTITGLAAFGTSLAVVTQGQPYLVQGTHPDSMVMTKLETIYPCLSPASIVDMGYSACYISTVGVVQIDNNGARLLTANLYSMTQWQDEFLESSTLFAAGRYDGRFVFFAAQATADGEIYMIDTTGETPELVRTSILGGVGGANFFYNKPENNELYYLNIPGSGLIRQFDLRSNAPLTYTWRSKRFQLGALTSFAWARCDALDYPTRGATVNVYAGLTNTLIHTFTTLNEPVRMPGGRLDDTFMIEVTGTAKVFNVSVGFDPIDVGA